jgi:TPR repeat protein
MADAMAHLASAYNIRYFVKDLKKAMFWLENVSKNDDNENGLINDGTIYLFGNKEFEMDMSNLIDSVMSVARCTTTEGIVSPVQCASQFPLINANSAEGMTHRTIFWDLMTNKKSTNVAACQLFLGIIYAAGGENISVDKKINWMV